MQDKWYFTKGNANSIDHPTVKSEAQTRAIILSCSRPNDLVFVPFAGSGTEVAMAIKEGRRAIGFEIDEAYLKTANDRINMAKSKPQLILQ